MTPDTRQKSEVPEDWIAIAELARRAAVTRATIHHYVKVGLLPSPIKTNSRMAYYDPRWVERIELIRELSEKRFLPLAVIKRMLDEEGADVGRDLDRVDRSLLEDRAQRRTLTREDLLERHPIGEEVFDVLLERGLLAPHDGLFSQEDAQIVACVHQMREAGLNEGLDLKPERMGIYVTRLAELIDREFAIFNTNVLGKRSVEDVARLARVGIRLSSRILASLHSRMLLDRIEEMGGADRRR